jgi:hypothetical protein
VHQIGGGNRLALLSRLVARQQTARCVGRLQQHIHHLRDRLKFVAPQTVQQRLHLVRQFGHIGKPKRGRAALDRVRAPENAVEFFVVGADQIQIQQHVLHLIEVLTCFFEKDLIELAQIKISAGSRSFLVGFRHGGSCCLAFPCPDGSADDFLNHFDQAIRIEGLHQPSRGTRSAARLFHLVTGFSGQNQYGDGLEFWVFAQLAREANAIESRHVLVGEHQTDVMGLCLFQGILPIHGFHHMVASTREGEGHHFSHGR